MEIRARDLVLDLFPALVAAIRELVGVEADHLQGVLAVRRTRRIGNSRADDEQRRVVERERPAAHVPADAQQPVDGVRCTRCDRLELVAFDRESRRFRCRVVTDEHRDARTPLVDPGEEILTPRIRRRQLRQVSDVDGRQHRAPRDEPLAVLGLDSGAAPLLEHEPRDAAAGQQRPAACFDQPRQRRRQGSGSTLR